MSRLYLRCGICGRQQAAGLLSSANWAHAERADRTTASVCPTCKESHSDWEQRVRSEQAPSAYGGAYRSA